MFVIVYILVSELGIIGIDDLKLIIRIMVPGVLHSFSWLPSGIVCLQYFVYQSGACEPCDLPVDWMLDFLEFPYWRTICGYLCGIVGGWDLAL